MELGGKSSVSSPLQSVTLCWAEVGNHARRQCHVYRKPDPHVSLSLSVSLSRCLSLSLSLSFSLVSQWQKHYLYALLINSTPGCTASLRCGLVDYFPLHTFLQKGQLCSII